MSYQLILGDRAYSSWSLRGWLLFERFGIPTDTRFVEFAGTQVAAQIDHFPAKTVPCLLTPEGAVIDDSLAIAEELASRHRDAGIWPSDPKARATARTLAAEMHCGFAALRTDCPMHLRVAYSDFPVREEVASDLRRLEDIWDHARRSLNVEGPWLCGSYSAADAMFAPVAVRIAGYGLPVSDTAQAYVQAHLNDAAFRRWRAMAMVQGPVLPQYVRDYTETPWPMPTPVPAKPVEQGPSVNDTCPYSGDPVTHFMEMNGQIWGFCNAFCRDKTVHDPAAWPNFAAISGIATAPTI